jgi:predicted  nucleic acid-binding Zn-ribbon protein
MKMPIALAVVALIVTLAACENEELIDDLESEREELKHEIAALEDELAESEKELAELSDFPEFQEQGEVQE